MFGRNAHIGIQSLPDSIKKVLRTEEDLEEALATTVEQENSTRGPHAESLGGSTPFPDAENTKESILFPDAENTKGSTPFPDAENTKGSTPAPYVDMAKKKNGEKETSGVYKCYSYAQDVHVICAHSISNTNEGYGALILCLRCAKRKMMTLNQEEKAIEGVKKQAEKMKFTSNKKFHPIEVGTSVIVPVPSLDRSKGDARNLIGLVLETTNDGLYKIGTKKGVIDSLYSRNQIQAFTRSVEDSTAAVKVSYVLSHLIASKSKPFTEGEFISECLIKAAEELCPQQIKKFKSVSLRRNTVANRVDEIAENLRCQDNSIISTFQAYSVAIDESTDIRNVSQLAVFIRGCGVNLKVSEELLEVIPMHNTTTGVDIFGALMEVLKKYKLPLEKLVCLTTDGAPTMTGITERVVARLKEACKQHGNNNLEHFHCIIHQQVLCSKVLNIGHGLKIVTKIVNYIRARRVSHRQFALFLEDIECEYTDLPYYTKVRWLSNCWTKS
ncbi:protein FAM200C-like [Onthophagus taurus]|uniref:protein FAM200C-like n=1 Tax=Onthophagus taurus TaxID=166361 RepID=UPI0039BE5665